MSLCVPIGTVRNVSGYESAYGLWHVSIYLTTESLFAKRSL